MKSMTKRLLAALLAVAALFALVGCGKSDKADAAPKDYTKILHDARPAKTASSPPSTATATATTPPSWTKRSAACCSPC